MAAFIMTGPLQAIIFIVLLAFVGLFLPLVGLLSNAAVGLIGLRLGLQSGLKVIAGAAVIVGLLTLLIYQQAMLAVGSTLIQWLAVLLLALLLQQTSSWRQVLITVFGCAVIGTVLFHISVADVGEFWIGLLKPMVDMPLLQQQFPDIDLGKAVVTVAEFATGVFVAMLSLAVVISLMIARHWQAMLYNPGGFAEEFRQLRLGRPFGLIMLVLLSTAVFLGVPLITDIVIAGMTIFLFQGISLVHGVRAQLNLHSGLLFGFYLLLMLMPVHVGLLLAVFGIIDSIADFRAQLSRKQQ